MDTFHYQSFYPQSYSSLAAGYGGISTGNGASSSSSSSLHHEGLNDQHLLLRDDDLGKKNRRRGGGVKLSTDPQSVAARERRHRISDRFKILQSLVPGGSKMDTVSMLEEAIHYVKFLKAQIWLHQALMAPCDQESSMVTMPLPAPVPFAPETAVDSAHCFGTVSPFSVPQLQQQQQLFQQSLASNGSFVPQPCWDYMMEDDQLFPQAPSINYYP